jgi:hypothetical protein
MRLAIIPNLNSKFEFEIEFELLFRLVDKAAAQK